MDDDNAEERVLKLAVCGNGSCGKTSLCVRFTTDTFDKNYHQTLGLDFYSRRLVLPGSVHVLFQVWDIGGQSVTSTMLEKYLLGSHAVLLVYDVVNIRSFDDIAEWLAITRRVTAAQDKPPLLALVGNKADLDGKRAVTVDMHQEFAKRHQLRDFFVCAKSGDAVDLMFRTIAAEILKIPLTKVEQEAELKVIVGQVAQSNPTMNAAATAVNQSRNSAVCSIQ